MILDPTSSSPKQVSDFGDSRPNYVLSAGSYIWKVPRPSRSEGVTLQGAKISPFKGTFQDVFFFRWDM